MTTPLEGLQALGLTVDDLIAIGHTLEARKAGTAAAPQTPAEPPAAPVAAEVPTVASEAPAAATEAAPVPSESSSSPSVGESSTTEPVAGAAAGQIDETPAAAPAGVIPRTTARTLLTHLNLLGTPDQVEKVVDWVKTHIGVELI